MLALLPVIALAGTPAAVENRFMSKEGRFELAPSAGYVPNNPFATRYVGGVSLAWHAREELAVEGAFSYSPDQGVDDLKGLTTTLIFLAGGSEFQQPLDKVTLSGSFGVRWAPLYGKINLVGEKVLNFDAYGVAAVGMASKSEHYARLEGGEVVLDHLGHDVKLTPVLGGGTSFFLTPSLALKLDARMAFYVDDVPDYEPGVANETDGRQRLYDALTASAGIGLYFPRMAPRVQDF